MNQISQEQIQAWAQKIRQSDQQAFDELFRWAYARLVRFAAIYTGEKSSACDVVQETFIALWQNRKQLDPQQSLTAYLYKIVRNRSLNYIRDHAKTIVHTEMADSHYTTLNSSEPQKEAPAGKLEEKFGEWIQNLPPRQKEAFALSRHEGLSHDEIAAIMGISPKTVNNHIVGALQQLRSEYILYNKKINRQN